MTKLQLAVLVLAVAGVQLVFGAPMEFLLLNSAFLLWIGLSTIKSDSPEAEQKRLDAIDKMIAEIPAGEDNG